MKLARTRTLSMSKNLMSQSYLQTESKSHSKIRIELDLIILIHHDLCPSLSQLSHALKLATGCCSALDLKVAISMIRSKRARGVAGWVA